MNLNVELRRNRTVVRWYSIVARHSKENIHNIIVFINRLKMFILAETNGEGLEI